MTEEHLITPPPELVREWAKTCPPYEVPADHIAIQAARWGADQELEACCEWLREAKNHGFGYDYGAELTRKLRAARRPKPPSLKELNLKHLEVMERDGHYLPEIIADLRRAIESLTS